MEPNVVVLCALEAIDKERDHIVRGYHPDWHPASKAVLDILNEAFERITAVTEPVRLDDDAWLPTPSSVPGAGGLMARFDLSAIHDEANRMIAAACVFPLRYLPPTYDGDGQSNDAQAYYDAIALRMRPFAASRSPTSKPEE